MRWQHGALHGCVLEHPFDFAADTADPKGLAPLCRAPAGQTKKLLDDGGDVHGSGKAYAVLSK